MVWYGAGSADGLSMNKLQRKVLMLAYCFPPVAAVGAFRMLRFVRYLPLFGWEPLVLTVETGHVDSTDLGKIDPVLEFPIDQSLIDYVPKDMAIRRTRILRPARSSIAFAKTLLRHRGDRVASSTASSPEGPNNMPRGPLSVVRRFAKGGIDNVLHFLAFPDLQIGWFLPALVGALSIIRKERPAVILSSGPPHTTHLIATVLAKLTAIPLVLDFRDPWSRSPWAHTRESRLRRASNRRLERWCVNHADRVMLNTTELRTEFTRAYPAMPSEKFVALPNGYDPELAARIAILRAELGPPQREPCVRICHPGSVYGPRDLRPLISAIARLSHLGCPVILDQIGFVEYPENIRRHAAQLGIHDRIKLYGQASHADALRHMANADLFVLCQPGTGLQIPAKVFEMLLFQRPVLALTQSAGAAAQMITQFALGLVAAPDDNEAIVAALITLTERRDLFACGDGWKEAMRAFNGRDLTGKLASLLDSIMVPPPCAENPPLQAPQIVTVADAPRQPARHS